MRNQLSQRDLEALSAYLDGQLSARQRKALEARLTSEEELQRALDDLSATRRVLRQAPKARAPRNFTLSPEMAGIPAASPRLYPVMRLVSAVASILFVFVFAGDLITGSQATTQRMAEAPAMESLPIEEAPAGQAFGEMENAAPEAAEFMDKDDVSVLPLQPTPQPEEPAADIAAEAPAEEQIEEEPMEEAAEAEGAVEEQGLAGGDAAESGLAPTPTLAGTLQPPAATAIGRAGDESTGEPSIALAPPVDNEYAFEAPTPKEGDEPTGFVPPPGRTFINFLEWGLGLVALVSGGITLWLRRKR